MKHLYETKEVKAVINSGILSDSIILKKDGKIKYNYFDFLNEILENILTSKQFKIYPKTWTGSRRNLTLIDKTYNYTDILKALGIPK